MFPFSIFISQASGTVKDPLSQTAEIWAQSPAKPEGPLKTPGTLTIKKLVRFQILIAVLQTPYFVCVGLDLCQITAWGCWNIALGNNSPVEQISTFCSPTRFREQVLWFVFMTTKQKCGLTFIKDSRPCRTSPILLIPPQVGRQQVQWHKIQFIPIKE